jgi:hypothetical protein
MPNFFYEQANYPNNTKGHFMKKILLVLPLLTIAAQHQLFSVEEATAQAPQKTEKVTVEVDQYLNETIKGTFARSGATPGSIFLGKLQRIRKFFGDGIKDPQIFSGKSLNLAKTALIALAKERNREKYESAVSAAGVDKYIDLIEYLRKNLQQTKLSDKFLRRVTLLAYDTNIKALKKYHKEFTLQKAARTQLLANLKTKNKNFKFYEEKIAKNNENIKTRTDKISNLEQQIEKLKAEDQYTLDKKVSLPTQISLLKSQNKISELWLKRRTKQRDDTSKWLETYSNRRDKFTNDMGNAEKEMVKIIENLKPLNSYYLDKEIEKIQKSGLNLIDKIKVKKMAK